MNPITTLRRFIGQPPSRRCLNPVIATSTGLWMSLQGGRGGRQTWGVGGANQSLPQRACDAESGEGSLIPESVVSFSVPHRQALAFISQRISLSSDRRLLSLEMSDISSQSPQEVTW